MQKANKSSKGKAKKTAKTAATRKAKLAKPNAGHVAKKTKSKKSQAMKKVLPPPPPPPPPFDVAMSALLEQGIGEPFARLLLLDHMSDEQLQQLSAQDWKDILTSAQADAEHNTERIQRLFGRFANAAQSFEKLSWLLQELRTNHGKDCDCDTEIDYYSLNDRLCVTVKTDEQAFTAFSLLYDDPPRDEFLKGAWRWASTDFEKLLSILKRMSSEERNDDARLRSIMRKCMRLSHYLDVAALLEGANRKKFLMAALECHSEEPEIRVLLALKKTDEVRFVERVLEKLVGSSEYSDHIIAHLLAIGYDSDKSLLVPHFYNLLTRTKAPQNFSPIFKAAMDLKATAEVQALLPSLPFDFGQWSEMYKMGLCAVKIHEISREHMIGVGIVEPVANEWWDGAMRLTILSMMVRTAKTYIHWAYIYQLALDHKIQTLAAEALTKFKQLISSEEEMKALIALFAHLAEGPHALIEALWDELVRRTDELMPPEDPKAEPEQAGGESGK